MPLKVFGGNWCGKQRRIVATTSKTKASSLMDISNDYFCETGNKVELEKAMAEPGVVFFYSYSEMQGPAGLDDYKKV